MLEPIPPRRDPRVLALLVSQGALSYAALDAWSVAGLGALPALGHPAVAFDLARLVLQVRPSLVVVATDGTPASQRLVPAVLAVALRRRLPVRHLNTRDAIRALQLAPAIPGLRARYHELRGLDLAPSARALRIAAAELADLAHPPRHYVPRQSARPTPGVASRPAPRAGTP